LLCVNGARSAAEPQQNATAPPAWQAPARPGMLRRRALVRSRHGVRRPDFSRAQV